MQSQNPCFFLKPVGIAAAISALLFPLVGNADVLEFPQMEQGIQIGDLAPGRAMIWSRADRASRMMVEYAFNDQFNDAGRSRQPSFP